MSVLNLNPFAQFNTVHCDCCDKEMLCRSLFNGDVWIMSLCPDCEFNTLVGED